MKVGNLHLDIKIIILQSRFLRDGFAEAAADLHSADVQDLDLVAGFFRAFSERFAHGKRVLFPRC